MSAWPEIPFGAWSETCATLHMRTQIVGKIRLALAPLVNHWWNATLYVSSRGLTTSLMPYADDGVSLDFDFVDDALVARRATGGRIDVPLVPATSVADFYRSVLGALAELGVDVRIWPVPVEVPDPIPFPEDERSAHDREAAERYWRALVEIQRVFLRFRGGYLGKSSPVHFFWGSFDLAVTRFSGRVAPTHPGIPGVADSITREAYSHECASAGFWPGGGPVDEAMFYAYAYPEPEGYAEARLRSPDAWYHPDLREYVLPYAAVRTADDPDAALLAFLEDTYAVAADLGGWDRSRLERTRTA